MAVVNPVKLIITNYPEGQTENCQRLIIQKTNLKVQEHFLFLRNYTLKEKTLKKKQIVNFSVLH